MADEPTTERLGGGSGGYLSPLIEYAFIAPSLPPGATIEWLLGLSDAELTRLNIQCIRRAPPPAFPVNAIRQQH